jgi:hypothetical protein
MRGGNATAKQPWTHITSELWHCIAFREGEGRRARVLEIVWNCLSGSAPAQAASYTLFIELASFLACAGRRSTRNAFRQSCRR